jgi:hypothetical protein
MKEYEAQLVPADRWTHVTPRDSPPATILFDKFAFSSSAKRPREVIVDRDHRERVIGSLTRIFLAGGWWRCLFRLEHPVAEHLVEDEQPVSISYTPLLTGPDGSFWVARLDAVSLVDVPACRGAKVVAVRDIDDFDPYAPFAMEAGLAAKLRSHGVGVPEPRPEPPRPVSSEDEPFFEQPWVRQAQKVAAKRGVLIRPGGCITGVR